MHVANPEQKALYVSVIAVAVASFAVSQGQAIVTAPNSLTPRVVFGLLATLTVVVVALGRLFGSEQSVQEGWTATHVTFTVVWAAYLLAGLGLVVAGFRGWVVFVNLAIPVVSGVLFWYLYSSDQQS
jgi:hypothetical protein